MINIFSFFRNQDGFRRVGIRKKRLLSTRKTTEEWSVGTGVDICLTLSSNVNNVRIEDNVQINLLTCNLETLEIGRGSYAGEILAAGINSFLKVGRYCSISSDVFFICGDGYHLPQRLSTYPFPFRRPFRGVVTAELYSEAYIKPSGIIVGHDVWIGHHVTILKNVKIGNGAVIASGSVLTRDVPDYAVVAGNPASIKKMRHGEEIQRLIQDLEWWNWSEDKIKNNIGMFRLTGDELKKGLLILAAREKGPQNP